MKFNCSFCKQYWEVMSKPYYNELRHKDNEATKDMTVFCPACRISKVRKEKWQKGVKGGQL